MFNIRHFISISEQDAEIVARSREAIRVSFEVIAESKATVYVRALPRIDEAEVPVLFSNEREA